MNIALVLSGGPHDHKEGHMVLPTSTVPAHIYASPGSTTMIVEDPASAFAVHPLDRYTRTGECRDARLVYAYDPQETP